MATEPVAVPVVVFGRNQALADELRRDGIEHAFGWVDDMPGLMHACDVLIQNAGGLTSLEAFAAGLPVVSYRCIPGHGQTNAAALDEAGLAAWIRDPADLGPVLAELLHGARGQAQRAAGLELHRSVPGPIPAIAARTGHQLPTASPRWAVAHGPS
ncbi:glycosyltransferase [Streptomyces guryensis]|uniref:glycosyltransferase n=1 Tax=Streptomyces guryensis TaxID=2886947 RepID=UPI003557EB67